MAFGILYGAQASSVTSNIQQQWILKHMLIISQVIGLYRAPAGRNIQRRLEALQESEDSRITYISSEPDTPSSQSSSQPWKWQG